MLLVHMFLLSLSPCE